VLWLGHIKWQLKTAGIESISDPVLEKLGNIRHQDAILAYDSKALARDEDGKLVTRWNGYSYKTHPITGNDVPDPNARVESYDYENPKRAKWPEAEFIVGNPPFIGGKDMRAELGDGYAEAAWKARPKISGGADFVMHFWDEAAQRLGRKPTKAKPNPLRRFGFITTNSITQTFSRRVVEAALSAKSPISLIFAVPDHPWMKASDKAAVRIAMTVAQGGEHEGILSAVSKEDKLDTDTPEVSLKTVVGKITGKLTIGADLAKAQKLISNSGIATKGMMLVGMGFLVTPERAAELGLGKIKGLENYLLDYRHGRDLAGRPRNLKVIDLYPLTSEESAKQFPAVYQHVLTHVKPERDNNRRDYRRNKWWWFGETYPETRKLLSSLTSYMATIETSKHRFFDILDGSIRPDNKLVAVGLASFPALATLSSRIHSHWSMSKGSWMGVGNDPVYAKSQTFDPFAFPLCITDQSKPLVANSLSDLGERLDAHRKSVMKKHDHLTMTGIYNVLERVRELEAGIGDPLSPSEKDVYDAALIGILKEIHDDIDRTTLEAYGWSDLAPALIGKVGATLPSPHKSPEQETAEEELLSRLVALNIERREEERTGKVRWLRPEYQIPKLGHKVKAETKDMDVAPVLVDDAPAWPKDGLDQIKVVREILARSDAVSATFKGRNSPKRKTRVVDVLETLVATGLVRKTDVQTYFISK